MNIKKGFIPDPICTDDYQYDEVYGSAPADMPDFKTGYDAEFKLGTLRDDHQGTSLACVSFGSTNDMEMAAKTFGIDIQFSQRYLYSQIHSPNGGASPRNAYKIIQKYGICPDEYMPTSVGKHMREKHARDESGLAEAKQQALKWKIKAYYSVSNNIDSFAQAIYTNSGVGFGYIISGRMGHFVFGKGYGYHQGHPGIRYQDSYEPYNKWMIYYSNRWFKDSPQGPQVQIYNPWCSEPEDWSANKETPDIPFRAERIEGRKEVLLILNNEPYWVVDGNPDMENLIKAKLLNWEDVKPVKEFTFPYNNRIIGKLNINLLLSSFIRGIKK